MATGDGRLPALALLALLAGCDAPAPAPGPDTTRADRLAEVAELYRVYQAEHAGRPPARLRDLNRYAPGLSLGYDALAEKSVTAAWGVPLRPDDPAAATVVLAYDAETATAGGPVLFQDGTVREVTAEAFRAAPKAR